MSGLLPFSLFRWVYRGKVYASEILKERCPKCRAWAVVALPDDLRAEQPDDTSHVCHPSAGGCNHGFARPAAHEKGTADE